MATQISLLPFDPSGTLSSNRITNEAHVLTPVNFRDFHFIVPRWAPFFDRNYELRYRDQAGTIRPLVEGVDYYLTHYYSDASYQTTFQLHGSFTFLDPTLAGVVYVDYNSLGGIWTLDEAKIAQVLADQLNNPRTTYYDELLEVPFQFPVINHEWDIVDMYGVEDIVESLDAIETALRQTGEGSIDNHTQDFNNPHRTNKIHVLLGNVDNYLTATELVAIAGTSAEHFMTPFGTRRFVEEGVGRRLEGHMTATGNVHQMDANDINAYNKQEIILMLSGYQELGTSASDTTRFDGKNSEEFKAWVLEGSAANAIKFGDKTYDQVVTEILGGTAANAAKFEGKTLQEVQEFLVESINSDTSLTVPRVTYDPTSYTEPEQWVNFAFALVNDVDTTSASNAFLITGGGPQGLGKSDVWSVLFDLSDAGNPKCYASRVMPSDTDDVRFGVSISGDGTRYYFWIKCPGVRRDVCFVQVNESTSKFSSLFDGDGMPVTNTTFTEPTNIVYADIVTPDIIAGLYAYDDLGRKSSRPSSAYGAIPKSVRGSTTSPDPLDNAATLEGSMAEGFNSRARGRDAIAYGREVTVTAHEAIAIGAETIASHQGSVALGTKSNTTKINQVALAPLDMSTSLSSTPKVVSGVADPVVDQDAVNLKKHKEDLDGKAALKATQTEYGGAKIWYESGVLNIVTVD